MKGTNFTEFIYMRNKNFIQHFPLIRYIHLGNNINQNKNKIIIIHYFFNIIFQKKIIGNNNKTTDDFLYIRIQINNNNAINYFNNA